MAENFLRSYLHVQIIDPPPRPIISSFSFSFFIDIFFFFFCPFCPLLLLYTLFHIIIFHRPLFRVISFFVLRTRFIPRSLFIIDIICFNWSSSSFKVVCSFHSFVLFIVHELAIANQVICPVQNYPSEPLSIFWYVRLFWSYFVFFPFFALSIIFFSTWSSSIFILSLLFIHFIFCFSLLIRCLSVIVSLLISYSLFISSYLYLSSFHFLHITTLFFFFSSGHAIIVHFAFHVHIHIFIIVINISPLFSLMMFYTRLHQTIIHISFSPLTSFIIFLFIPPFYYFYYAIISQFPSILLIVIMVIIVSE